MFPFLTCPVLSANQIVKPRKHKQSVWSGSMWRGLSHGLLLDCFKLSSLWQMNLYPPQPSSTCSLWHPIGSNWIWQWKKGMTDDRAFWEMPWSCLRKTEEYSRVYAQCGGVCVYVFDVLLFASRRLCLDNFTQTIKIHVFRICQYVLSSIACQRLPLCSNTDKRILSFPGDWCNLIIIK